MKYFNEEDWSGDPNDMYFAFDNHLVSRSVKIFADGALRTGGAAVSRGSFLPAFQRQIARLPTSDC